ncbi:MAG: VOC family protein [Leptolyngbya sp. SIOISBB]|nr:VOC family protein [Leptolyngbya sp. SIOISBB]
MQITKLDHIGLRVMDVNQSMQFYQTLGFQIIRRDEKEQVFVVKHPSGIEINLIASGDCHHDRRNILMDVAERYPGYTHYAIAVASVAAAKTFLEDHHIPITEGPITFGDGKTSIFIRDPDLNVLEFTELPQATLPAPE